MKTSKSGLLDPYVFTLTNPWNKRLVSFIKPDNVRSGFPGKHSLGLTPSEAVDQLFQPYGVPDPGAWVTEARLTPQ
jgi:hypothetical protein